MRYALDIPVRNAAIAEALLKHGCTQRALAEMAGVNQSDLAGWATLSEDPYDGTLRFLRLDAGAGTWVREPIDETTQYVWGCALGFGADGAAYLVLGRAVTAAADPAAVLETVHRSLGG